jgi:membrane protein YqaA with SNARE-associated domain
MSKLLVFAGATLGGAVGWWLGAFVGVFTAFTISMIGTGVGMYAGRRFAVDYLE